MPGVDVSVEVGVTVGVSVIVAVGVTVGVSVGVPVGVAVGVVVGVAVGVSVGVMVGGVGGCRRRRTGGFPAGPRDPRHARTTVEDGTIVGGARSGGTVENTKAATHRDANVGAVVGRKLATWGAAKTTGATTATADVGPCRIAQAEQHGPHDRNHPGNCPSPTPCTPVKREWRAYGAPRNRYLLWSSHVPPFAVPPGSSTKQPSTEISASRSVVTRNLTLLRGI